jgi:hypothetical protein
MGIGVIFMMVEVLYCWGLRVVLRKMAVEARRVEVKNVVRG